MNYLCSYQWLTEVSGVDATPDVLARTISLYGPSVERMHMQASAFEYMVVGKITAINPHPNADSLKFCMTDIGKKTVQIVCGGSNVAVGMFVAVALPGARVKWHGEGELVTLAEATIRGEKSIGMICGADEIGLADRFSHAQGEIVDLTSLNVSPGTPLATALHLDDTIFDIEVTTNRVDMMGIEGIARETAAAFRLPFVLSPVPPIEEGTKKLSISIKEDGCMRYRAVSMDIVMGESPVWMQSRLRAAGINPINVIVDIGNYVMLETGQPLHAFDSTRMSEITVRMAKKGEVLQALDGNTYTLEGSELVIANKKEIGALAGIMGSRDHSIATETSSIIWEAATFDGLLIRRAARLHTLYSESQGRFEKQTAPELTVRALERAVQLTRELAQGTVTSKVFDSNPAYRTTTVILLDPQECARLIGAPVNLEEVRTTLTTLGFEISGEDMWEVRVPYWRVVDVTEPRDILEEVVRMIGYHTIPPTLPTGHSLEMPNPLFALSDTAEHVLVHHGYSEALSYSMLSAKELTHAGLHTEDCVTIANPLSEEGVYLRPSLLPSLLTAITHNEGQPSGNLFEIASRYTPQKGLPHEERMLALVTWGDEGTPFYTAKESISAVLHALRLDATFEPVDRGIMFHPSRAARIMIQGVDVGTVGEVHPQVLQHIGIDERVAAAQLSLEILSGLAPRAVTFVPPPPFPGVKRDIALIVDAHILHDTLVAHMRAVDPRVVLTEMFDAYQGKGVPEGKKSVAFHLEYRDTTKTLSAEEALEIHERLLATLEKECDAVLRT